METIREKIKFNKRIVVKIGTSSISYENGRLNFRQIENIARVLSELRHNGKEIILVSSGAIGVGAGRLGMAERPEELSGKQALAAIGQAELIKIYQKFFEQNDQVVAQVLLTKDVMTDDTKNCNAQNTLNTLMNMNIIPIINENDTISIDEIVFGDNDSLSAYVAALVQADLLIMLSDIDGLYSDDPKVNKDAEIISTVDQITPEIENLARGAGTTFGTGGMVTKIIAAKICSESYIDTVIMNGQNPFLLYELFNGSDVGTYFHFNQSLGENL
jgi:glutamate 5-kinase